MKILQVIPVLSDLFGGPVSVVRSISKELAKKHDVTIFTTSALDHKHDFNNSPIEVQSDGYRILYFPRNFKFSEFNISMEMARAMRESLINFDVLHVHSWRHFQELIVHHYSKKYEVPFILQAHGTLPRIMEKKKLKWIYDTFYGRRLLNDASMVIALNQNEAKHYRCMGVSNEKITVVPNGIDLSEYGNLPPKGSFKKKYSIDNDDKIVLYLGRINRTKGIDILVRAFANVIKNIEHAKLVVVGPDDGYASEFSRLVSNLGIKNKVLSTGFVDQGDKLCALVDSEVLVIPHFDGFPVTFLEACYAGCPIVTATDELDWIHDNVGYVTENSHTAIAKAIYEILHDEATRVKFRDNCNSTVKNFNISIIASQLEHTYRSVARRIDAG